MASAPASTARSQRKFSAPSKPRKAVARKGSKREAKAAPSPTIDSSVVDAINALRNNETRVTSEVKGLGSKLSSETKVVYPPELVLALRGMFPSTRVYEFQLHQVLTVQTSVGLSTLGFVAISPSVASYGEWTALAALFDEVHAVSTSINWVPTTAQSIPMMLAVDEQNLSTDPSSYLSVYRLAGSRNWDHQYGDNGSGIHRQRHKFTTRLWCTTAVPYSTSPIGGMIGCWVYGNGTTFSTGSVPVAVVSSVTRAKFRSRA